MFAYKELPIKITNIAHEEHPVKVGLSDAYIIDRTIFCESYDDDVIFGVIIFEVLILTSLLQTPMFNFYVNIL